MQSNSGMQKATAVALGIGLCACAGCAPLGLAGLAAEMAGSQPATVTTTPTVTTVSPTRPNTPEPEPTTTAESTLNANRKEATDITAAHNQAVYEQLDFTDQREIENAERGLIAAPERLEIKDADGNVVWSQDAFEFVEDAEAPDSANPSLWRHTQMNHNYGLFEVMPGIYQVRGYDISNLTLIEGETGWIIFDPLTNVETAQAALALANEYLGERPVVGIVISHSHPDHFNGIRGVLPEDYSDIPIIVPEGFAEHAVSEVIYAGTAMARRAEYMYGKNLEPGVDGRLAVGLGVGQPSGTTSYVAPTDEITYTGETRTIDGVEMEFQLTPGTEAPAEMNTWFPQMNALWLAENCTGTLHNLYTLRGAQVRDGNAWATYLMETISRYGDDVQVAFQSHNWPHWGNAEIDEYMLNTAAAYKFINDQTLLYLNQGDTMQEIADKIELPPDLAAVWYTRPYYGTPEHNSKGVYQKFLGWYDANPAHLNPLPLTESAAKFVEYMGDADAVLEKAQADFANGEYRWVAEVTAILVYADPSNTEARYLCADALEQLGYQAEAGTWRAAYLTGAEELREGSPTGEVGAMGSGDMLRAMTPQMIFDYLGINVDSNAAADLNAKINVNVIDDQPYLLTIKSGVVLYQAGETDENADLTITIPRAAIALLVSPEIKNNENVQLDGDVSVLDRLQASFGQRDPYFNIIEP